MSDIDALYPLDRVVIHPCRNGYVVESRSFNDDLEDQNRGMRGAMTHERHIFKTWADVAWFLQVRLEETVICPQCGRTILIDAKYDSAHCIDACGFYAADVMAEEKHPLWKLGVDKEAK